MNKKFNPEMLKLIRKSKGLTQKDICNKPLITQGTLSKLEQGLIEPNNELLHNLSECFSIPVEFFYQDGRIYPPAIPFHRSRMALKKLIKEKIEAMANIYRIQIDKLSESIEVEINIPKIESENMIPSDIAKITRSNLRVPYGPIKNMIELLENNGVFIILLNFNTEQFDGFTIIGDGVQPIIFINKHFPVDRIRFT